MKLTTPIYFWRWYVVLLFTVTGIFLTQLAMADPLCTNCSVALVKWAMPRAEALMVAWAAAGGGFIWFSRDTIARYATAIRNRFRAKTTDGAEDTI